MQAKTRERKKEEEKYSIDIKKIIAGEVWGIKVLLKRLLKAKIFMKHSFWLCIATVIYWEKGSLLRLVSVISEEFR